MFLWHIYKVLHVLHFMLIIKSDLPLASGLIIVSCSCHGYSASVLSDSINVCSFCTPEDVISDG